MEFETRDKGWSLYLGIYPFPQRTLKRSWWAAFPKKVNGDDDASEAVFLVAGVCPDIRVRRDGNPAYAARSLRKRRLERIFL